MMPMILKQVVKGLIEWLREQGITMDDPYDFTNFIADHCSHSQLFEAGAFVEAEDD